MVNIIGPGLTGDQATSSRPSQISTGSGIDLWFKDCTSEAAQDGTRLRAQWFNFVMAQFREAIRGMGIAENETDDTMLLKCFQALQNSNWLNLPIYPESLENDWLIDVTAGTGEVIVDAGQSFLHRGWNAVLTNDYTLGNRSKAHSANKTYHLRWQYNAGSPQFVLKDTADVVYNPTAAAETNAGFDSTFDDMLIAKVVTNGSNVATITKLLNKAVLVDEVLNEGQASPRWQNMSYRVAAFTYNWARTPQLGMEITLANTAPAGTSYPGSSEFPGSATHDIDLDTRTRTVTRYSASMRVNWDFVSDLAIHCHLRA